MEDLKFPSITIIAGRTNSGKSHLVRSLVYKYASTKIWNRIRMVCPTLDVQQSIASWLLPDAVIAEPSEEYFTALIANQQKNKRLRTLLILDDIVGVINFHNNAIFDRLAAGCRHYRLSLMIVTQDLKKISPILRANAAYLFVTELMEHSLKTCFELVAGFESLRSFKKYMQKYGSSNKVVFRFNLRAGEQYKYITFEPGLCPEFRIQ